MESPTNLERIRVVIRRAGRGQAPGYNVSWAKQTYTLAEHFAKMSEELEGVRVDGETGYTIFTGMTDSKLEKILSDPKVALVVKRRYGTFNIKLSETWRRSTVITSLH